MIRTRIGLYTLIGVISDQHLSEPLTRLASPVARGVGKLPTRPSNELPGLAVHVDPLAT